MPSSLKGNEMIKSLEWHRWTSISEAFETYVNRTENCWEWTGSIAGRYGRINFNSQAIVAHRWSYENYVAPIPPGLQIDHLCRNKLCVNPDHLEAVTSKVNTLRSDNPAAVNARKNHCLRGHLLSGHNSAVTNGHRKCRTCANAGDRRRRAEKRARINNG